jgi:hypothetical protein
MKHLDFFAIAAALLCVGAPIQTAIAQGAGLMRKAATTIERQATTIATAAAQRHEQSRRAIRAGAAALTTRTAQLHVRPVQHLSGAAILGTQRSSIGIETE